MPVKSCGGGKWRIGSGKCIYKSKAAAQRAYKAYLAKNPGADEAEVLEKGLPEEFEQDWLEQQEDSLNRTRRGFLRRTRWRGF
jgi:hypothetical protein